MILVSGRCSVRFVVRFLVYLGLFTSSTSDQGPNLRPTPPTPPTPTPDYFDESMLNIFDELVPRDASLEQKIVQIEHYVCGSSCRSPFPSSKFNWFAMKGCPVCQCDETCVRYHNCCPEVVLRHNVTYEGHGSECMQLVPTDIEQSFDFFEKPSSQLHSSVISNCDPIHNGAIPEDFLPMVDETEQVTARLKCQRPDISKPEEALPVTDTRTNLTYRNVYCAVCNGIDRRVLHMWTANISCSVNGDRLLEASPDMRTLFHLLTRQEEVDRTGCCMQYVPTLKEYRRECRQAPPEGNIVSKCKEGGRSRWRFYGADVEKACGLYTSVFVNRYKNMFCYICNQDGLVSWMDLLEMLGGVTGNPARLSFSALLDFSNDDDDEEEEDGYDGDDENDEVEYPQRLLRKCTESQFFDNTTCSCREVYCSDWQTLHSKTKTCRRRLQSQFIGYHACLEIDIGFSMPSMPGTLQAMADVRGSPNYKRMVTVSQWCPGNLTAVLHLQIWEMGKEERDGAENSLEDIFQNAGRSFCGLVGTDPRFYNVKSCRFEMVPECPEQEFIKLSCEGTRFTQRVVLNGSERHDVTFLPYRTIDHCAFVKISAAEFRESDDVLIHLLSSKEIVKTKVDFMQNENLTRLCLEDYFMWTHGVPSQCRDQGEGRSNSSTDTDHDPDPDRDPDTWTTAGLISIITSCISLLFLFLTFLTYLLFAELRTDGCKNIMVMIVNLFIAQALYEFTLEQTEDSTLCSIFGILLLYFWLASIFSMNACTVERFVKLCFPLESRLFFMSKKPFVLATVHTFLCPLIIVSCNAITNIELENRIGYGRSDICFINGWYRGIFLFTTPMIALVVLNVVLMVITIVKLRRPASARGGGLRSSSRSRIGLVACVRLSLVTGGAWLVSLLYKALPYPAMGYLFTAFLGLQGVVIFFSLLANRRVLALYVRLLTPTSCQRSAETQGKGGNRKEAGGRGKENPTLDAMGSKGPTHSSSPSTDDTLMSNEEKETLGGHVDKTGNNG